MNELRPELDRRCEAVNALSENATAKAIPCLEHDRIMAALDQPRRGPEPGNARANDDDVTHPLSRSTSGRHIALRSQSSFANIAALEPGTE